MSAAEQPVLILVVEDDQGDQLLIQEAFEQYAGDGGLDHELVLVNDGEQALDFVRRRGEFADARRPDLVLLDLNLPRYDGRTVLAKIKTDDDLRTIPVVIFTTSARPEDITGTYRLHANAYVSKPTDFDDFSGVVKHINEFFTRTARLPRPPMVA